MPRSNAGKVAPVASNMVTLPTMPTLPVPTVGMVDAIPVRRRVVTYYPRAMTLQEKAQQAREEEWHNKHTVTKYDQVMDEPSRMFAS